MRNLCCKVTNLLPLLQFLIPWACKQGIKSTAGAIKCCKENKIAASPNTWHNILFLVINLYVSKYKNQFKCNIYLLTTVITCSLLFRGLVLTTLSYLKKYILRVIYFSLIRSCFTFINLFIEWLIVVILNLYIIKVSDMNTLVDSLL